MLDADNVLREIEAAERERAALEQAARERIERLRAEKAAAEEAAKEARERAAAEARAAAAEKRAANVGRWRTSAIVAGAGAGIVLAAGLGWGGWTLTRYLRQQAAERAAVKRYAEARAQASGRTAEQAAAAAVRGAPVSERTFFDCADCPLMTVVPAGSFLMGSPESEIGRFDNEGPQHSVTIPRPFAVGRFELTWDEWDACVRAGRCGRSDDSDYGRGTRPAINLSWNDAQAYVQWLSRETGQTYRLLTEAEWEYAARAGSAARYSWGDAEASCDRGAANGANFLNECNYGTLPVGAFAKAANAFGLYDVHGNVSEWVQDCYRDSYVSAPADGSAVETGEDSAACPSRVVRGGYWYYDARSAYRYGFAPVVQSDGLGARLARTVSPP